MKTTIINNVKYIVLAEAELDGNCKNEVYSHMVSFKRPNGHKRYDGMKRFTGEYELNNELNY